MYYCKKYTGSLILLCMLCSAFFSCKKSNTETGNTGCEVSVSSLAGKYRLTKAERVAFTSGTATDITSTISNCELTAEYNFDTNGTATYTESSACTGSGSGTWRIEGGDIVIEFTSGNGSRVNSTSVVSWNCATLVLITRTPATIYNYRYTLSRLSR